MEPVAAHAFVVIGARQPVDVGDERLGAMEGGVEAGDLRRLRERFERRLDAEDVERLVQLAERDQGAQGGEQRRVDARRVGEVAAAVEDAVADRDDVVVELLLAEPAQDRLHRRRGGRRRLARIERELRLRA